MDFFGKNDPYVKVKVHDVENQTSVLEGAGAAPVWGFGDGELLVYPTLEKPNLVEVTGRRHCHYLAAAQLFRSSLMIRVGGGTVVTGDGVGLG